MNKTTASRKTAAATRNRKTARHPDHAHHPAGIVVAEVASPLGPLLVYGDATGVVGLDFPGAKPATGSAVVDAKKHAPLRAAGAALKDYFAKGTPLPADPVGALEGTPFQKKVWRVIAKIPFGKTLSYAAIAAKVGKPGAARAVGTACGANPLPLFVPCHRVLAANGRLGGFSGGLRIKELLLRHEGVDYRR